jgi:hypothetical protein
MRCLALFTGGLDSLLSVRLMQVQGIEVVGLHIATALCVADRAAAEARAASLGIELRIVDLASEYCQLLRSPRFGRLEGVAPCLDCRIAKLSKAREFMTECGASYVTSGEVVGQRPKTAIRDLEVVAHHAGLADLLVRPLSAQLLPATAPETRGWIDRTRLLSIQGKSRKTQLELARTLDIADIPAPRPDCPLLTEPLNSRVKEVLISDAEPTSWLLSLLRIGRHCRVDANTRIIVGRNHAESDALVAATHAADADACSLAMPHGFAGPTALVIGRATAAVCEQVTNLIRQHGRSTGAPGERVEFPASPPDTSA